jgi:hypothetical protein
LGVAVAEKFLVSFLELRWYATAAQLPQFLEDWSLYVVEGARKAEALRLL